MDICVRMMDIDDRPKSAGGCIVVLYRIVFQAMYKDYARLMRMESDSANTWTIERLGSSLIEPHDFARVHVDHLDGIGSRNVRVFVANIVCCPLTVR